LVLQIDHPTFLHKFVLPPSSTDEIGDLALALDEISKDLACKAIGKDGVYEFGDLSRDVDSRIKNVVADYCGKDTYERKLR
jgi:hypothetical protein